MRARMTISIVVALLVGAGVAVGATRLLEPTDAAVRVEAYLPPVNERQLTVRFTMGTGDTITLARFDEHDNAIVVTVRARPPSGPRIDLGLPYEITATLQRPVGGRTIVDGSSGGSVRQASD